MPAHPPIYGFDLVTDTLGDTVDPVANRIEAIAVDTGRDVEVLTGDERTMLVDLDDLLVALAPGVIATWNGSLLDLPLIAHRSAMHDLSLDLVIRTDRRAAPASPILELDHAVCGAWGHHQHVDLRRVYAAVSRWRKRGRLDPETMIPPANELAPRDPAKDARLARRLAERRWGQARKFVDRMPERAGTTVNTVFDDHTELAIDDAAAVSGSPAGPNRAADAMVQMPRRRRSDR